MRRRTSILLIATVVWIVGGAALSLRWLFLPAPERRPPDVVLLTVDTLRADRLGCYGATQTRTPSIDRLAAEGTLFESAACPMPATRPSLASLHTSMLPREHGVTSNALALPQEATTLAEVLRAAGYETAAFVAVKLLDRDAGLAEGFDFYDAPRRAVQRRAPQVAPAAIGWLRTRDASRPAFLWLHLFDPHMPYLPAPEPGSAEAAAPGAVVRDAGAPARSRPGDDAGAVSWSSLAATAEANGGDVPAATLERALDLYAGEVELADRWIGAVRQALEELGRLDRTIVVLTADHGECFDHGVYFEHTDCIYDGAVHVPLVVRFPPGAPAGRRVAAQVGHPDVAPTILALAGLAPPPSFRGRPLLPFPPVGERYALIEHPLLVERAVETRERRGAPIRSVAGQPTRPSPVVERSAALRSDAWKLIVTGEAAELYDLHADPGERQDLAGQRPEIAARLEHRLREELAARPAAPSSLQEVKPRLRRTLRALGYLP